MGKLYDSALSFVNDWTKPINDTIEYKKVSVVIPVYHPEHLSKVLMHLSKLEFIFEVITVFDNIEDNPEIIINEYNYRLLIIQHDRNRNAPAARNTGALYATGDIILFLDQDMILSPKFLPNALNLLYSNNYKGLVVGFRDTTDCEKIPGVEKWQEANYLNDWRIQTTISDKYLDLTVSNSSSLLNVHNKKIMLKIYKETNEFRKLGLSKETTLGYWDLACMVISHTLAIPKKEFIDIGGFPEWIVGWGGEDIALGFLAISKNLFIIPAEVGSYHIKHSPHSGSEERKWEEMKENLKKYKMWAFSINEYEFIPENKIKQRSKIFYDSESNK